ncbi:MAG: hypothetical protein WC780_13370 [Lentimicrobiaceae bacterium]|jgi:hypothetical protein
MTTPNQRAYNCKDEELPVICRFAVFSLTRDLSDFTDFSPKFDQAYITAFNTNIASVNEVIMPASETLDLKNITTSLYATMDGLIDPINRVTGYLNMLDPAAKISAADFGLARLRKNIKGRDAEGAITSLHTVTTNLSNYATILGEHGLKPELSAQFSTASTSIAADNQKQYEITSNRKTIVQNNVGLFNSLNEQLTEIMRVGKILYKAKDAVKTQEYTFAAMKKKVKNTGKSAATPSETPAG